METNLVFTLEREPRKISLSAPLVVSNREDPNMQNFAHVARVILVILHKPSARLRIAMVLADSHGKLSTVAAYLNGRGSPKITHGLLSE